LPIWGIGVVLSLKITDGLRVFGAALIKSLQDERGLNVV
jgi:hypothetical protein